MTCSNCKKDKPKDSFHFRKKVGRRDTICYDCTKKYQQNYREKHRKNGKFPYKGLNDPQYIKDRDELFMRNNDIPMPEMKVCTIKQRRNKKSSGVPLYKINLNGRW